MVIVRQDAPAGDVNFTATSMLVTAHFTSTLHNLSGFWYYTATGTLVVDAYDD